jgi:hypothetical protein
LPLESLQTLLVESQLTACQRAHGLVHNTDTDDSQVQLAKVAMLMEASLKDCTIIDEMIPISVSDKTWSHTIACANAQSLVPPF